MLRRIGCLKTTNYSLFCYWLRLSKVREQVPNFGVGQAFEKSFGHQAVASRLYACDPGPGQTDVDAVEATQNDDIGVLVSKKAAQITSIFSGNDLVLESFPDFGIRVDDANEHGAKVVALVAGEVRTNFAALVKKRV